MVRLTTSGDLNAQHSVDARSATWGEFGRPSMFARPLRLGLAAVVILTGCGGGSTTSSPPSPKVAGVVTATESDCTFAASSGHLTAGVVTLKFVNQTDAEARFDGWHIPQGHTFDELAAHIREERRHAEAGEPVLGPPSYLTSSDRVFDVAVDAGKSDLDSSDLGAGTYAIVCIKNYPSVGLRPLAAAQLTVG